MSTGTYEYVQVHNFPGLSRYMAVLVQHDDIAVHDCKLQYMYLSLYVLVCTGQYWYILVTCTSEYKLHVRVCARAILLRSALGKRWIGCLCRQIHKCMYKRIYSWSWRQSLLLLLLLLLLAEKQHTPALRQSLLLSLQLAGKPLAAVAEAGTAAGPEDRTIIFRTAPCRWCSSICRGKQ